MQEPWKRAAQLARARGVGRSASGPPPGRNRPRQAPKRFFVLVLMALLVVGLAALWAWRGWWIPRYRNQLPQTVSAVVREPRAQIDWPALERGLGVGLLLFGDYAKFMQQTRDWPLEWQVTATRADSLRIDGAGLQLYTRNGSIENYKIDVKTLFADAQAEALAGALRDAGISPDLTWTALSGEDAMPHGVKEFAWLSPQGVEVRGGWVHREYVLYFSDGWLSAIEGRFKFGAGSENGAVSGTVGVE